LQDPYAGEPHIPSLADRVVDLLATAEGRVVVDCTLGHGGHAERILDSDHPPSLLIGIDRDPAAVESSRRRLARFGPRVRIFLSRFSELDSLLEKAGVDAVGGILYDLGISSPQIEVAERGFSYTRPGPLDMRMDPSSDLTAEKVVNTYPQDRLETVIRRYGEERHARRVAREIVRRRPLRSTADLVEAVEAALPKSARSSARGGRIEAHPARRTFQAIRIEVNKELDELEASLPKALEALEIPKAASIAGGRIICISYHSLEDRIVKRFIDRAARGCVCPPELPVCGCGARPLLKKLTPRVVRPSEDERMANPRARSARLRAAERTPEPAPGAKSGAIE
jgi:16S rRNA (cytosine1402-N4)-methyltransferase